MNYTLHQLKLLVTIAQTKSITKAAEILHLTQPAVSIQLRNLQDQFDAPLTEVIGRKLYMTDFGNEIGQIAQNMLNEAKQIEIKSKEQQGQLAGTLKLANVSTAKYIIPYFLTDFLKDHPGVNVQIDVTNKRSVLESLEKNQLDFALVSTLPTHLKIEKIKLMPNKLLLVGGREAPIIESLYTTEAKKATYIYREEGSATRQIMEQVLKPNKNGFSKKIQLKSNEAVKQAVVAGLGYSIMPLIGLKNELQNGNVKVMPIDELPIVTHWHLIWLKEKRFSPAAQRFLEYIQQNKESITKNKFNWFNDYKV